MFLSRLFLAALCAVPLAPASAHEFWIEPFAYQLEGGERLQGHFMNGQAFAGTTLAFFDRSSARFEMKAAGEVTQIEPRSGDSPALDVAAPVEDGLVVVAHETTPTNLTYREWDKFLAFAEHKDFPNAAADHLAAGWSKVRFKESYTRHVKTLVAVGSGAGADSEMGLVTEFVAITNPYEANFNNQMKVEVLYNGAPRPDVQVEVFDRAPDDTVMVTLHRTDDAGRADIPVLPGHEYLFDAVVLRPFPNGAETPNAPLWETFWAALTFAVPE